jgi:hypothetical protein
VIENLAGRRSGAAAAVDRRRVISTEPIGCGLYPRHRRM